MPSATIIHAAFFAVGAAVGAGTIAALGPRKKREIKISSGGSAAVASSSTSPILNIGPTGAPTVSQGVALVPSAVLKYGNPGPIADLLVRKAYVAAYDRRLRHPAWTAEHLTLSSLGRSPSKSPDPAREGGDRQRSVFTEDEALPIPFRARLQDYFRSGYDRGHMVPAADAKLSQDAMDETFLLSNIAPQVGDGFNRHYWAYVEDWCRRLTGSFADVYVFTIPLYLPTLHSDGKWRVTHEVIGNPPNVAVPTHFSKVVLATRPSSPSKPNVLEMSMGAFVMPNAAIPEDTPLESFMMPVDAVERSAGLTLFSDALKLSSKNICKTSKCELVIRRFDDAQKRPPLRRSLSAPN
ncbi:hypothetical protein BD410DRAFT_894385 [Rickenella mellea]|uniref:Endonuclease n=1 Tax=Rickenella mellea TaxID=50990 RepID=A0A4Y7QK64_9AGAM|nr:hypothetical protein BD410DRAFT_894385 [Rickenella mellea]